MKRQPSEYLRCELFRDTRDGTQFASLKYTEIDKFHSTWVLEAGQWNCYYMSDEMIAMFRAGYNESTMLEIQGYVASVWNHHLANLIVTA